MSQFEMPPSRTLPEYRRTAMRRQVEARVSRRSVRKPLFITAGAVVVAAGTSAGAYAYVQHSQPVTDKSVARCYTVASLSAGPESYTTLAEASRVGSSGRTEVGDALSFCSALWRQGILHSGPHGAGARGPAASDPPGARTVPPLAACVLPDGTAAVFPGNRSVCAALRLPNATG